ncbi:acyl-CoA dehydrogenase family protein [Limnoglobus roseus]|uniref:Acyl-CoA dehydrogenase n=1 Tax=Limnoglobus roseus TaxID=2598579 RepID=A0A5C1A2Q8_9BACT|nr:acyl-CoA dehydrogenase family protein [Limnoglobus roseus]QEL13409.1 acyl-CoA dehydrogenase [Limnoglobus roseus]
MNPLPLELQNQLTSGADAADRLPDWPPALEALRRAGLLAGPVAAEFGGRAFGPIELLHAAEDVAAHCLTTAFILSQRDAAIRQLAKGPPHLRERYLPGLASGDLFLTIGLSQLTTSRLHRGPALRATPTPGGYRLDGEAPWVTGADRADAVVVGATLPDDRQLLVVLPTDRPGVVVDSPMVLACLVGSRTSVVRCAGVEIEDSLVLAGPADRVLGAVGGGGLETSNLALGLSAAAVAFLEGEAKSRAELVPVAARLRSAADTARERLHALATTPDPDAVLRVRVDCTRLALRSTQLALLAAKGAGFVVPHPAQRWARQAHFFLVWSCPRPVAEGVLEDLLPAGG